MNLAIRMPHEATNRCCRFGVDALDIRTTLNTVFHEDDSVGLVMAAVRYAVDHPTIPAFSVTVRNILVMIEL